MSSVAGMQQQLWVWQGVCFTSAHAWLSRFPQERRRHEEEIEANNGVFYRATLTAVPAPESIAADKGIRRAADKVRQWGCSSAAAVFVLLRKRQLIC